MNAIVVMAIGDRYQALFEACRKQFENYAKKCGAKLEVCIDPPDPTMEKHLFTQKMLLPKLYSQYEWIAFLDLDILISKNAPSIFEFIDHTKGFGAVIDPIGEAVYLKANKVWFNKKPYEIKSLQNRFINEGFAFNEKLKGIINGGVWLAKPQLVGEIFSNFYITNNKSNFYEEIPMSFLSQNNDLFFTLDRKFNNQLIYFATEKNATFNFCVIQLQKRINKILKWGFDSKKNLLLPPYISLIESALGSSFIIHFSGGYPVPRMVKNTIDSNF